MGILDAVMNQWGQWSSDPNRNQANDAFLNQLAAGLLSGRSNNFGVNLGNALTQANQAHGQGLDRAMRGQLTQAQIAGMQSDDLYRKAQIDDMKAKREQAIRALQARQDILGGQSSLPANFDFKAASQAVNAGMPAPQAGVQGAPTLQQLQALQMRGLLEDKDIKLFEQFKPQERKPGSFYVDPATGVEQFRPDVKEGIDYRGGQVVPIPGAAETRASMAGAVKAAEARATAPYDVVTIPQAGPGGAPLTVRKDVLAGEGGAVGGAQTRPMSGPNPDMAREILNAAIRYNIRPDVAFRLFEQESRFNPEAVSPKGAVGVGQLMPGTAKDLGVDPRDWRQNIDGSMRYLRQQLDTNKNDYNLALAAYNAGPGRVAKAGGVPNIPETQKYVSSVMGDQPIGRQAGVFPGVNPSTVRINEEINTDTVKRLSGSFDKASTARGTLTQIDDMRRTLDEAESKGNLLAGPGTKWGAVGKQLASMSGLSGKDADEWLARRASLVQGAAKLALDGAAALAGQGAISEYERKSIAKANSADLDSMTMPEIRAALDGIAKVSAHAIDSHGKLRGQMPRDVTLGDRYVVEMPERYERAQPAQDMRTRALEELRKRGIGRGAEGAF